jgi:hypothetical protein
MKFSDQLPAGRLIKIYHDIAADIT